MKNFLSLTFLTFLFMEILLGSTAAASFPSGTYTVDIERPIKDVIIRLDYDVSGTAGTTRPTFQDSMVDLCAGVDISIAHVNREGKSTRLYNDVKLGHVAEFYQDGEGAIKLYGVGTAANKNGSLVDGIRVGVPISLDGALIMSKDETLVLKLENLPVDAGFRLSIWGLDSHVRSSRVIQFHNLSVPNGSVEKQFNLTDIEQLVLPKSQELKDIQLQYTNATTETYTMPELEYITDQKNDIVAHMDEMFFKIGSDGLHILEAETVHHIDVTTTKNSYYFYSVSHVFVTKPSREIEANAKTTSTVLPVQMQEAEIAEQRDTNV